MTKSTPKEMAILAQASEIQFKLAWLDAHPGRTRRDYAAGLKDPGSEVWKWRRAQGEASVAVERAAWEADHPGQEWQEHQCGMSDAESDEYAKWYAKWLEEGEE